MVILHTNHGDITLELDASSAPKTVANFLQYVRDGHYDNTVFHRVIDGFMIQGGGMEPGLKQKPTRKPVASVLDHTAPTAQGWGYCVFGKVVAGQDVVDKIKGVATADSGFHQNVPREDVIIVRAEEVAT